MDRQHEQLPLYRNVQEMNLGLYTPRRFTIPWDLFSSTKLTVLVLDGESINLVLPASCSNTCVPCLKTCHLGRLCFDGESARRLIQSCPALQDLHLYFCRVKQGVEFLDISSSTLKKLTIEQHHNSCNYKIVLDVPSLVNFIHYGNEMATKFLGLESLKRVVDARICYGDEVVGLIKYPRDDVAMELVRAITHVPKLHFSLETIEAFARSGHSLPIFKNMTSLQFGPISRLSWMLLPSLLDNSPRLEYLTLYQGGEEQDGDVLVANQDKYIFRERVPDCVAKHLKEVHFYYIDGLYYDHKLVSYFLKHAKNLKKMKIGSRIKWNEQIEIISSASCQIDFISDGLEKLC